MPRKYPPFFSRFKKRAAEIIKNPGKVPDELAKADEKAEKHGNQIRKFIEDLKTLIRLVRASTSTALSITCFRIALFFVGFSNLK